LVFDYDGNMKHKNIVGRIKSFWCCSSWYLQLP